MIRSASYGSLRSPLHQSMDTPNIDKLNSNKGRKLPSTLVIPPPSLSPIEVKTASKEISPEDKAKAGYKSVHLSPDVFPSNMVKPMSPNTLTLEQQKLERSACLKKACWYSSAFVCITGLFAVSGAGAASLFAKKWTLCCLNAPEAGAAVGGAIPPTLTIAGTLTGRVNPMNLCKKGE